MSAWVRIWLKADGAYTFEETGPDDPDAYTVTDAAGRGSTEVIATMTRGTRYRLTYLGFRQVLVEAVEASVSEREP
jgi:hypothetical protein